RSQGIGSQSRLVWAGVKRAPLLAAKFHSDPNSFCPHMTPIPSLCFFRRLWPVGWRNNKSATNNDHGRMEQREARLLVITYIQYNIGRHARDDGSRSIRLLVFE